MFNELIYMSLCNVDPYMKGLELKILFENQYL